jgi:hypothetical protein
MHRRRVFGGLVMVAVLAACGSSSKEASVDTTTTTPPTTSTTSTSTSVAPTTTTAPPDDGPQVTLLPDGLGFVIGTRTDTFGFGASAEESTTAALAKALGDPSGTTTGQPCEDGSGDTFDTVTYPSLRASFVDGKLVGWQARTAAVTTAAGIGIGSTLADLRRVYDGVEVDPQSSLGVEWSIGGGDPRGLLSSDSPRGRVDAMWAGHVCVIR